MKPIFETTPILNRIIAIALIALGAGGLGSVAPTYLPERANYMAYSSTVTGVTGVPTTAPGLDVCLAGAAIVLVAGVIGLFATVNMKSKPLRFLFIAMIFLAFVGGVVELAGSLYVTKGGFLAALGPNTYVYNEALANSTLAGAQESMAMFGLAVFDQCCRPHNWVSQGPFAACDVPCPSAQSGDLIDQRILQFVSLGLPTERLCTCVRTESQALYDGFVAAIGPTQCANMARITTNYDATLDIPTTPVSLGTVKNQLYPQTSITRIPLIGYQLDAATSNGTAQPGYGFGCGLGYPKGVMWFQEIYHDQFIVPPADAAIGTAVGAIIISAISFFLAAFLAREDADMGDGRWENTLAADWNDPKKAPVPVAQVADSTFAPPVSAYQMNANDFSEQLLKFYARHDPLKTQKEIDNIAAWGKQNGLAALNKKLRDKYGADLTGGDGGPPI